MTARLIAALLVAAAPARAAIQHDSDIDKLGVDSVLSVDTTIGTGDDRYLLVSVITSEPPVPAQAVSLDGAALGFLGAATTPHAGCRIEWWGLAGPAAGAHTVHVQLTATSTLGVNAVSYAGVHPLGAVAATASGSGVPAPTAVTVASAPEQVVLDGVCGWSANSVLDTAGPDQETRWHWSGGSLSSAGSSRPGAASVTMTWTESGPQTMEWAAIALALRPATDRLDLGQRVQAGCGMAPRPAEAPVVVLIALLVGLVATRRAPGSGLRAPARTGDPEHSSDPEPGARSLEPGASQLVVSPGTFGRPSRGTVTAMRTSTSRVQPAQEAPSELDEITLARAKAGDASAQTALIHRYERPVFSLLWRMVGPQREVVEDLTQETFLRVLRALPRFDHHGRARLVTWILTITARLALDHLRASKPRPEGAIGWGGIPVALPTPDQEAHRRALGGVLVRAVEGLGPPYRAAFLLREVHGMSYDEIGVALSIDVGTVKSRLSRARAALQACLAEMHDE